MNQGLLFVILSALGFSAGAQTQCKNSLPVKGFERVQTCDVSKEICVSPMQAIGKYAAKLKGNDDPALLNMVVVSSPWRFYDGQGRILTVDEIAARIRTHVAKGVKRVALIASWSGVRPDPRTPSLAEQVARLLGNIPVNGAEGFLWISPDGKLRTSRHAATIVKGGRYEIGEGAEVLTTLAASWPANFATHFSKEKDAEGLLRAGAGFDVHILCPARALELFEESAKLGNPIAAYNAALMRLDRREKGDLAAATGLLSKAAGAGDKKAQERLQLLKKPAR